MHTNLIVLGNFLKSCSSLSWWCVFAQFLDIALKACLLASLTLDWWRYLIHAPLHHAV